MVALESNGTSTLVKSSAHFQAMPVKFPRSLSDRSSLVKACLTPFLAHPASPFAHLPCLRPPRGEQTAVGVVASN